MTTAGPALRLSAIEKRFGSTAALSGASLTVNAGTLHMLLGENGAGKTTLLRIAAGFIRPDAGELFLKGVPVRWRSRSEAFRAGIAAVEQHFSLVPAMSVSENVALADSPLLAGYSARAAFGKVRRIADAIGLSVDPEAVVADLSVAGQQRAEIVKALATDASVLILDEPTAVLSPRESDDLFAWLRRFVDSGRTAVIITHRIREALQYGDFLTVLRAGQTVLSTTRAEVSPAVVVAAILGTSNAPERPSKPSAPSTVPGEPRAELRDVSVRDATGVVRLRNATVTIRAGETVGVAGVEGSGQRELLRVLAGRLQPSTGSAHLAPAPGFVPEDRLRDAMIPAFSLTENFALRGAGARRGLVHWPTLAAATVARMREFSVHADDVRRAAGTLSGGNQQKFILAREIGDTPALIVTENPTRGLDVRAANEVMDRLVAARNAGSAVVIYSSDIEELVGAADRVLVCFNGTLRETAVSFDAIGAAMLGSS